MVQFSQLTKHRSRLVCVLRDGARQRVSRSRADGLLMVGDVSNQQGAELRDQLQIKRLPESEEEEQVTNKFIGCIYNFSFSVEIRFN